MRSGPLAGRVLLSTEGREYRKAVDAVVRSVKGRLRIERRINVEIMAYPPDKRRRDLDNVQKAILDALQHSCVFDDDSQVDDLWIRRCERVAGGAVTVTIFEVIDDSEGS